MGPLVSIVIPTFNRRELLKQALGSILAQTHTSWEVIVVDDASHDGTNEAIAGLSTADARIRFQRRAGKAGGAQVCRNQGFAAARGKYVVFMDSDDLLATDCLERRVAMMQQDPLLDFVVGSTERFCRRPGDLGEVMEVETSERPLERFLRFDCPWQTMSPMWSRESLWKIGPWDERLIVGQDMEFHCRALLLGLKYRCTGRVDCFYRDAEDGRETIGRQRRTVAWYLSQVDRISTAHRLMWQTGTFTDTRRALVLGNYLQWAMEATKDGFFRTGLSIWNHSRRCGLTERQMFLGRLFLLTCRTWFGPLVFHQLMANWPRNGFVFTRRAGKSTIAERRIALTDLDHPMYRYTGPLREGFFLYILRRLHPRKVIQVVLRNLGWRATPATNTPLENAQVAME